MVRLLEEVDVRAGADFSGVGIIVADSFDSLPLINLRPTNSLLEDAETATALARISHHWHEHHDGFHVLTPELKIEKVAQYFSPPIVPEVRIRSEEHTSELQSLMRISYAVFCLKKKKTQSKYHTMNLHM